MAHMVKQTIEYSDGTETVTNFTANEHGEVIEQTVTEAVAAKEPQEVETVKETPEEIEVI